MTITFKELLNRGKEELIEVGVDNAELDAWYLFEFIFCVSKMDYLLNDNTIVQDIDNDRYMKVINIRAAGTPLQYITGEQEFMGLKFFVNQNVLIPRQDTETLVEEVMKVAHKKSVLDMCTGSGCIIISLAKLCDLEDATGIDLSMQALDVAKKNRNEHKVEVEFLQSDLFEQCNKRYDIIVSNPPYIPTEDINNLMREVKNNEPILALDGMEDGIYFYRKIIKQAKNYLNDRGQVFFEIGYDQGNVVKELLEDAGFDHIKIVKDLVGLDRVVCGSSKN